MMQSTLTRWLGMPLLFLLILTGPVGAQDQPAATGSQTAPEPVVNGVVIPQKDIDFAVQQIVAQRAQRGEMVPPAALAGLQNLAREQVITEELLVQDSRTRGIEVPDQRIADDLARIRNQFQSEEQYRAQLAAMQMSESELKRKLTRTHAINLLLRSIVADVEVSDEEVKTFYEANPELFKTPEQVRARHILIKVAPEADAARKKEALQEIKEVQKKVRAGEDFAALAEAHSQGPSSVKGGDLNFFGRGQMVKPFEEAAFALQPDEVSDIVETSFGYHLIKVTERREAGVVGFEEARPRIAQNIKKEKEGQMFRDHVAKLRAAADIKNEALEPVASPSGNGG
jgi:peptidyl-prolyl cis-trans isomerase C